MPLQNDNHIYVCQSGTCRSKGSDAALVEIEELAKLVGNCNVGPTQCLGYCSQGPAVEVIQGSRRSKYHVKVNTFRKSARVVESATGKRPPLENLPPETESRLSEIRATKRREYFVSTFQWNKALCGLAGKSKEQIKLRPEFEMILYRAGYQCINPGKFLKHGHLLEMPASIEGYVPWTLQSVEIVSSHSAIFKFSSDNRKRGTPHPRGRGQMAQPITWHVTMLGQVGANEEGPLPWIERDYTPISSALEWERGRCEILIKIYRDGRVTSWLEQKTKRLLESETKVWLSKPIKTLSVPSLVSEDDNFRPASVLLLLAGTGIVALPQIMAHREPHRLLGISTARYKQLRCPIDLIHVCREDDILLLSQIRQYCSHGMWGHPKFRGLRNYTLLLTKESKDVEGREPPFQGHFQTDTAQGYGDILKDVPNAKTMKSRLNQRIIANAIGKLVEPYRVVVSGPDAFNKAAREFLDNCGVESTRITMLSA